MQLNCVTGVAGLTLDTLPNGKRLRHASLYNVQTLMGESIPTDVIEMLGPIAQQWKFGIE